MKPYVGWSLMSAIALAVLGVCGTAAPVSAEVRLPSVISSNMVLQREKTAPIWGWADAGESVKVELNGQQKAATADAKGRWQVEFSGLKAGGPHTITITGKNTLKLDNVLVGEVWVCSGQSNMEWPMTRTNNPEEEIASAKYPQIRLLHVPRRPSTKPIDDVESQWRECSPETISSFSAVGYFFGRHLYNELNVPVGLINTSWGGTRIEPWTPPAGFENLPKLEGVKKLAAEIAAADDGGKYNHQQPTMLYNGMVHGLVPFGIRGAIWYQGESNRGEGMLYFEKMKALIGGWRSVWNQGEFPFLFVQLAPFKYGGDNTTALPEIWEAQVASMKNIPNTGMAVTVDIGNVNDIHPRNKQDVGKRLALWALAKTYGKKDLVYSGPIYQSMVVEGAGVRIHFDHVGGGLISRDGHPLSHFQVAGADGKFVDATAKIDGNSVIVSNPEVKAPKAVRFAWDQLAEPNLSNKEGLPASPFRTDG